MTKKLLKQLLMYSYTNNTLNQNRVLAVAERLDRSELKQYIHALKLAIKKRTVYIESAYPLTQGQREEFSTMFADKTVVINSNADLLAGIRIVNNDDIVEMNLKQELDDIIETINSD